MVAAVMWLLPINASAAGGVLTYEDFNYVENDDGETVTITGYTNTEATSVEIPQTIDGKTVTEIGSKAFYYKDDIKSVVIPDTVTTIWDEAFSYCMKMETVDMSANVETIGDYAFRKCGGLRALELPESLTSIGEGAFHYAFDHESYASITIPSKITEIPSRLFDTAGVTSVDMSKCKITSIGENAFYQCFWLTSIDLPDTLTTIGESAFWNAGLTSLTLPETVTTIGESAFYSCPIGGKVVIPAGVTAISDGLFCDCDGITSVELPATITKIGDSAFRHCSSLVSVNIPDKVTSIGTYAFNLCSKLAAIDIPEAVTSIGAHAFERCETLRSITIPEGVTAISDGLFTDCSALISVTIPDSVTSIGKAAFDRCKNLTKIVVPERVTSIGNRAFYGCTKLTDVNIPEGVTTLSDKMFYGCTALKSITLPVSVRTIGRELFAGCTSLSSVTVYPSVTSIGTNIFSNCSEDITINCQENSSIYNYAVTNSLKTKLFETIDYVIDLSDNVTISTLEAKTFTGEELTQTGVTVKMGTLPLTEGTDYTLEYENNIEAGKATMTVKGCGHFEGAQSAEFTINVLDISSEDVKVDISGVSALTYNGKAQAQSGMTAKIGSYTLVCDKDYVVDYRNNENVGTATIQIRGTGSCKGTVTSTFEINPIDISDVSNVLTITGIEDTSYTGEEIKMSDIRISLPATSTDAPAADPELFNLGKNDFDVTYENNVEVGTAKCILTAKGNYKGTIEKEFAITRVDITEESSYVQVYGIQSVVYTGKPVTLEGLTVEVHGRTLVAGKDYEAAYANNTDAGEAEVTITGIGSYKGVITRTFVIEKLKLSSSNAATNVSGIKNFTYNGAAQTQSAIKVTAGGAELVAGRDYKVTYTGNTNVGTATVTITGTGNYDGVVTETFKINAIDIADSQTGAEVSGIADKSYTGSAIAQSGIVVKCGQITLKAGTDYDVKYSNNVNVGTAQVMIVGKGVYTGTIKKTFAIKTSGLSSASVSGIADKTYTGSAIAQSGLVVKCGQATLKAGTDYDVKYSNNVKVGKAELTVVGKGAYTGTIKKTFAIKAVSIKSAKVSGIANAKYTGRAVKQAKLAVKVGSYKLKSGTDYTVTYKNNKNIGKATVTIKARGNYTGTVVKTFSISAKKGATYTVGGMKYKVTSAASNGKGTVALAGTTKKNLTSLNVASTVKIGGVKFKITSVASKAFKNSKKLTKVNIAGSNVTSIGASAFYGCKKLTTLTVGKNVKTIGSKAFYGCSKLKTVKISSTKLANVGSKAFAKSAAKPTVKASKTKLAKYKKLLKKGGMTSKAVYKAM